LPPPAGGQFELRSYSTHANELQLEGAAALVDLFSAMRVMRSVLSAHSTTRKRFTQDMSALVAAHHGGGPFALPLQTRLYVMQKA
jgi:hypothetical protein